MQAWLQEFAWTEAEKLHKWKTRAGNLRLTSAALHDLNKEPMFCFESAIKLYYYSHIIYHYDKVWSCSWMLPSQAEVRKCLTILPMLQIQSGRSIGARVCFSLKFHVTVLGICISAGVTRLPAPAAGGLQKQRRQ